MAVLYQDIFKQYEYALYGAKNGNQVLAQCMIIILSFQEIFLWQIYIKNKPNGAKTESVMTLYGAKTEIRFDTICWCMYHQFLGAQSFSYLMTDLC